MLYRQGDILLSSIAQIPSTARRETHCILAYGEATGHIHEIKTDAILWTDTDGSTYVEVCAVSADLIHPEHGVVTLPGPAIYRVIRQREYTPKEIRYVSD